MNNNLSELVFLLDMSGSMSGLENDTIGGFNSFIQEQKNKEGEALLTTILFDHEYEVLHNGLNIQEVKPLTNKEYHPRGSTALLDAIGKTIVNVGHRLNGMKEEDKPSKVIFVITTDGYENSSKEFNQKQIKEMIEHQTNIYNWQFLFLGANIDAVTTAQNFGIHGQFASNYSSSSIGTQSVYTSLTKTVSNYRDTGVVLDNWNDDIE